MAALTQSTQLVLIIAVLILVLVLSLGVISSNELDAFRQHLFCWLATNVVFSLGGPHLPAGCG
jgi:hypothetical protein